MCTPVVVIFVVPDVIKIAAVPIAAQWHALGSAGVMGPWGSPDVLVAMAAEQ